MVTINVFGHEIKIENLKGKENLGEFDIETKTIYINFKLHKKKKKAIYQTLLHECIHALLELSGVGSPLEHELEEQIVLCLDHNIRNIIAEVDKTELI